VFQRGAGFAGPGLRWVLRRRQEPNRPLTGRRRVSGKAGGVPEGKKRMAAPPQTRPPSPAPNEPGKVVSREPHDLTKGASAGGGLHSTRHLWLSIVVGLLGVALLVTVGLWSTGLVSLPGPLATLRSVPEEDQEEEASPSKGSTVQDRAREFRDHLLGSIWRDHLVTLTVHVALCDSRLSKVANPAQGRGDSPKDNLYWGAMYGVEKFFERQPEWSLVYADTGREAPILRRVVFLRNVNPTPEWGQRGVTKPFQICLLAQAWPGPRAADAMRTALAEAIGARPPQIIQVGERKLRFGSGSDAIGYMGYNAIKDGHAILPGATEAVPKTEPRGVFFICSSSAEYLGVGLRQLGLQPVLLTTQNIAPEAYVLYGITEALASGQIEGGFAAQAAQQYAHYKAIPLNQARRLFTQ
jgi:hypothetical protein